MILKGVTLQDVHFGHKHTERMYDELEDFLTFVEETDLDIVHLNGDYFHRKLTATEPAIAYAIKFFDRLVELCVKKNIKLINKVGISTLYLHIAHLSTS